MLDAVRLVMDARGIIVVLAIDPGILMEAVKKAYGGRGRDYLSKIIQLPIHLRRPHPASLGDFAKGLIPVASDLPDQIAAEEVAGESLPTPVVAEASSISSGPGIQAGGDLVLPSPAGAGDKAVSMPTAQTSPGIEDSLEPKQDTDTPGLDPVMRHSQEEQALFVALAKRLAVDNPRRLIRLRNTYRLMRRMWSRLSGHTDEQQGAPLRILQVLFMADAVSEWPAEYRGDQVLKSLEAGEAHRDTGHQASMDRLEELKQSMNTVAAELGLPALDLAEADSIQLFRFARSLLLPHPAMDPGPDRDEAEDGA